MIDYILVTTNQKALNYVDSLEITSKHTYLFLGHYSFAATHSAGISSRQRKPFIQLADGGKFRM